MQDPRKLTVSTELATKPDQVESCTQSVIRFSLGLICKKHDCL